MWCCSLSLSSLSCKYSPVTSWDPGSWDSHLVRLRSSCGTLIPVTGLLYFHSLYKINLILFNIWDLQFYVAEQQSAVVKWEKMLSQRLADLGLGVKQRFLPFLITIGRHGLVNLLTIVFGFLTAIQLFLKKGLLAGSIIWHLTCFIFREQPRIL